MDIVKTKYVFLSCVAITAAFVVADQPEYQRNCSFIHEDLMEHYNNVTKGKGGVVPRYMHEEDDEEDSDMMAYERASDFVMDLVMDQGGYRMMDRDEDGYEDGDEVGRWDQEGTRLHEIRALCSQYRDEECFFRLLQTAAAEKEEDNIKLTNEICDHYEIISFGRY